MRIWSLPAGGHSLWASCGLPREKTVGLAGDPR
jgi:hypothetical protein